jgi:hypothetical protein
MTGRTHGRGWIANASRGVCNKSLRSRSHRFCLSVCLSVAQPQPHSMRSRPQTTVCVAEEEDKCLEWWREERISFPIREPSIFESVSLSWIYQCRVGLSREPERAPSQLCRSWHSSSLMLSTAAVEKRFKRQETLIPSLELTSRSPIETELQQLSILMEQSQSQPIGERSKESHRTCRQRECDCVGSTVHEEGGASIKRISRGTQDETHSRQSSHRHHTHIPTGASLVVWRCSFCFSSQSARSLFPSQLLMLLCPPLTQALLALPLPLLLSLPMLFSHH